MRHYSNKIPLYFGELIIFQGDDWSGVLKKYNLEFDDTSADGLSATVEESDDTIYIMLFKETTNPRVIAHEALHLTNFIFADRSIRPDLYNDEPQAYLLGWIVQKAHEVLKIKQT